MGADPVGTAILHAAAAQGRTIDSFVVRKAQKSYGMARQVEGPASPGAGWSSWRTPPPPAALR